MSMSVAPGDSLTMGTSEGGVDTGKDMSVTIFESMPSKYPRSSGLRGSAGVAGFEYVEGPMKRYKCSPSKGSRAWPRVPSEMLCLPGVSVPEDCAVDGALDVDILPVRTALLDTLSLSPVRLLALEGVSLEICCSGEARSP
jgi:hypothetical protein